MRMTAWGRCPVPAFRSGRVLIRGGGRVRDSACPGLFFGNFQWPSGDVEAGEGVASADGGTGSDFRAREGDEEARAAGTRICVPAVVFICNSRCRSMTSRLGEVTRVSDGRVGPWMK